MFNDRCATGVLDVLHRAGRTVPGDISVIGCDDSRLARRSHVNLTTVAQDAEQITTLAVSRAIDRLNRTPVDAESWSSHPIWSFAAPPPHAPPWTDRPQAAAGTSQKEPVA